MNDTDLLELRKDICLPGSYYRAGEQCTRAVWLLLFPHISKGDWPEWFIDLTNAPKPPAIDLKRRVVAEVFAKRSLHSISYKMAAVEAITEYQKQLNL